MSIVQPGSHLGPYEVLAQVGAGGMGEVWKARDTRLARSVAIKTSREQFSERFEREARAVAALNHPHICQLYDVGPNYLVMEYIEGQPLPSPLPLDQALKYGAQICDALDAAHRKGIVHRDLKPANILVTKTGGKLLDFGLARMEPAVTADDDTEGGLTGKGQILGTLHYMSPEQLHGEKADSRSDIFSFGLVLYEMLTGKHAFDGSSPASVIAAILEREAPSVAGVAPAILDRVMRRCLAKDPDLRWQSAADLKSELEWIAEGKASATTARVPALRKWRELTAWVLAGVLLAALLLAIVRPWRTPTTGDLTSFAVYAPEGMEFAQQVSATVSIPQFALSPDGRNIVFVASAAGAAPMLWLRPVSEVTPHKLPGTENAQNPFWSPDSRWVGFFSAGKLMKIPADGGATQEVAKGISDPRGGSWGPDGTILFCGGNGPVFRVPSAGGGPVTPVTKVDFERQENSHRWPQFLPDGQHFLYMVGSGLAEQSGVYVGSVVEEKTKKHLIPVDTNGFYVSPGYLLYVDRHTLFRWAFDAERLELNGQPFTVAEQVGRSSQWNGAFSASQTGALAYAKPNSIPGRLTWFDRAGNRLDTVGSEGDYSDFRLSPDETKMAASLVDSERGSPDIWLTDFARGSTPAKVTFGTGARLDASVIWSPDSHWILFRTSRHGLVNEFYRQNVAGNEDEPVLLEAAEHAAQMSLVSLMPSDWSFDGGYMLFSGTNPSFGTDLWKLPMIGDDRIPVPFVQRLSDQMHGNLSPNGRIVAYTSNESGKYQVYAETVDHTQRLPVSTIGGYEPRWRADGKEMYYLSYPEKKLMVVSVGAGPSLSFGVPKELFQTQVASGVYGLRTHYDTRKGQRFLINTQIGDRAPTPITVVLNWAAALKK